MNPDIQFYPRGSRNFDVFAIASSATDISSQNLSDYPSSSGSRDIMLEQQSPDTRSNRGCIYNRPLFFAFGSSLWNYYLLELFCVLPTGIEIQFFETESSSHLVESESGILDKIRDLIEKGRVADARHFVSTLRYEFSDNIENWRRVLARPKVMCENSATGSELRNDALWIRTNSENFKGKWVALKQGSFLGSHDNRTELHRLLKQDGKLHGAMFFKVEKE